ncbi:hypothetical protein EI94DRAFT_1714127 [Lactarius quietus]|nr:hypothetical protein EI94DRAFT_1714127 [Lactarius quietus]
MDNAFAIRHQPSIHELFLPPLDITCPTRTGSPSILFFPTLFRPKHHTTASVSQGAHDDNVIPSHHDSRARTVVLCFDGTGDQFDADNSNIVNLFSMLKKGDNNQQIVYYQAGIGTYAIPQIATPMMVKWQKTIDMAIGNHLDAHVMEGYEFLMERYHAKDNICIFGFSRGAYTARALAGMINKVGLLPSGNYQQVPFAYAMYSRDDETGWEQSTRFKKTFSMDVGIEFVGGYRLFRRVNPRTLPFTQGNTAIRYFRHAISLDERRTKPGEISQTNQLHPNGGYDHDHKGHTEEESNEPQRVREVWFAGCHTDIGGGAIKDETPHSLARISLRWMIHECFRAIPEFNSTANL